MVPSRWPIRSKFGLGIALVLVIVLTLFTSAYYGLYAYRELVKGLSLRSAEIPLAIELSETVSKLNLILARARTVSEISNEVGRDSAGRLRFAGPAASSRRFPGRVRDFHRSAQRVTASSSTSIGCETRGGSRTIGRSG